MCVWYIVHNLLPFTLLLNTFNEHGNFILKFFIIFAQQMHSIYEQYMFLKAFLLVSMFIHHPQGVSYYVR